MLETESLSDVLISVPAPEATDPAPYNINVDEFSRLIESDFFPRDRRIYLMNGRLYEKMSKTKSHVWVGGAINMLISSKLPEGWCLLPESTMALSQSDAPLPDFAIVRSGDRLGSVNPDRYPESQDIGILIEVSFSSLKADLTTTLELYARSGVPVYWVVDVQGVRILVHSKPTLQEGRGLYTKLDIYIPGQEIPIVLNGREVARISFDSLMR